MPRPVFAETPRFRCGRQPWGHVWTVLGVNRFSVNCNTGRGRNAAQFQGKKPALLCTQAFMPSQSPPASLNIGRSIFTPLPDDIFAPLATRTPNTRPDVPLPIMPPARVAGASPAARLKVWYTVPRASAPGPEAAKGMRRHGCRFTARPVNLSSDYFLMRANTLPSYPSKHCRDRCNLLVIGTL